jgi:hypothetical protein
VDEDGLASIPCSGDFKRSLSSFCKRSVAAMCSFFLSARSEEEAFCLLRELFSNEVTHVTFSSRVFDFLQICAATAPMTTT